MLEIRPLQDTAEKVAACDACGITFDPDKFYYGAYSENILVGVSEFRIEKDRGVISHIVNTSDSTDKDALFVAGRATLNFIDLCGVHSVMYSGEDEMLAKRIGFKNADGVFTVDTSVLFAEHCG